ncbi:MAG TPA: LLM class F420-dependent oxidoreductase [Streptosporangiaceae bacterium]|jgi:F420-dependent oxidoreductase-like protein|nr:LLM class F420-dependent oxidoreductase [Streptosporangiaceae bacterium]
MKLGLLLGLWGADGPPSDLVSAVRTAESVGYESVWTSEAFGSDALTPLAWLGARTSTIGLGTSVMHMAARAPAATAMAALSLDHLSGGRFSLGLGLSGPDLVKGWYGQPFDPPLGRTRDYLGIVRRVLAADAPVRYDGKHLSVPLRDEGPPPVALTTMVRPLRPDLPVLLGAEGPKNVALAREIADGWIATYYSPYRDGHYRAALAEGAARPGVRRAAGEFEVMGAVPVVLDDDVEAAADRLRPLFASFIGPPGRNFHREAFIRMGLEEVAVKVSALWSDGHPKEAAAAIPTRVVEQVALIGPPAKLRADLDAWRESLLTTLLVYVPLHEPALRQVADLVLS